MTSRNIWPLLASPALALAQTVTQVDTGSAKPDTPVAGNSYRSVFDGTPRGVVEDMQDWRRTNDEVGQFTRGHMDIMKWERAQEATPAQAPEAGAMPMHQEPRP